jgi:hypothetical protein
VARHKHKRTDKPLVTQPRVGRTKNALAREHRHIIAKRKVDEKVLVGGVVTDIPREYSLHATKGYRSTRA